jgi:hypothetical protein
MVAATIPLPGPDSATAAAPKPRRRKPWSPDSTERLIYRWVKFEGKTQSWIATNLKMHQGNVSRAIQRYEKWLAHAQPGDDGQLTPDERLRTQRWLTYERNEVILASAMRIAGDMEGFTDVSKSVSTRPIGDPAAERNVRTEYSLMDRSGIAARFLRLAFQINMQQLKLVESEPPAPLPPLVGDEFDDEERDDVIGRIFNLTKPENEQVESESKDDGGGTCHASESGATAGSSNSSSSGSVASECRGEEPNVDGLEVRPAATTPVTPPAGAHNAHNREASKPSATPTPADPYAGLTRPQKERLRRHIRAGLIPPPTAPRK